MRSPRPEMALLCAGPDGLANGGGGDGIGRSGTPQEGPGPERARQPVGRGAPGLYRSARGGDRAGEGQDRRQTGPSGRRRRAIQAGGVIPRLRFPSRSLNPPVTSPSSGNPMLRRGTQPSLGSAEVATSLSLLSRSRRLNRRRRHHAPAAFFLPFVKL